MNLSKPFFFELMTNEVITNFTQIRDGEVKIGEKVSIGEPNENTKFLIIGLEESIGPRANYGTEGAEYAFPAFLRRFLNMQSNKFLCGKEITILGSIKSNKIDFSISGYRDSIIKLDEIIEETLYNYINKDIITIIIGGGHNNTYPIINTFSKIYKQPLFVVNCDPHADCRKPEGRHSGNGFSYAFNNGSLSEYCPIGLHKAFNNEYIYNFLENNKCLYTFFEDYIKNPESLYEDVHLITERFKDKIVGLDIDLDSIAMMPSSAFTPSGLSLEQVRYLVQKIGLQKETKYLYLTEGAPISDADQKTVGKALAYLCWDFISNKKALSVN
jgi:formiminoglutamase